MNESDLTIKLPPFTIEKLFVSLTQAKDWGLQQMKVEKLWKKTKGKGITIAVLDTGCPGKKDDKGNIVIHPDLRKNILVDKCESFIKSEDIFDYAGHSTACCGVIAAEDNETGFVGYAPEANIICYKVLNKNGAGSLEWIEKALQRCIQTKPDIVSMSLGSLMGSYNMHQYVKKLDSMGIPVICAAGNGGKEEGVNYPAFYNESFAIGAYDNNLKIANFSAIGDALDFAFPGVDIHTTWLNNGYTKISGTSFACPACAGLVALILAIAKAEGTVPTNTKNTLWIYDELKKYATNPSKFDTRTKDWGWGYIDIQKLIEDKNIEVENLSTGNKSSDIFSKASKYKLINRDRLNQLTDDQIHDLANMLHISLTDNIVTLMDNLGKSYYPAFAIYVACTGDQDAEDVLKKNLIKTTKAKYCIINPKRWYKNFLINSVLF